MTERHIAIFDVPWDVLLGGIELPKGSKIVGVSTPLDAAIIKSIEIAVLHPDLPLCASGCRPIRITPSITRIGKGYRIVDWELWKS